MYEGCPDGWASYTGQVEIARKLVAFGADSKTTDYVIFYNCPPLLLAAENGQLESMKFLVEELRHTSSWWARQATASLKA